MSRKLIILLSVVIVAILAIVLVAGWYVLNNSKVPFVSIINPGKTAKKEPPKMTPEQEKAKIEKDFSETVTGVIRFLDSGSMLKTTITTDSGKVYTLSPAEPESVYESLGAEDGGKVQVRAKSLNSDKLVWRLMEPL